MTIVVLAHPKHASAKMHVHGLSRIGERLALILVNESGTIQVGNLNDRYATLGNGAGSCHIDGNLCPALKNLKHDVVLFVEVVEGSHQKASPATREIRNFREAEFANPLGPPEVFVK